MVSCCRSRSGLGGGGDDDDDDDGDDDTFTAIDNWRKKERHSSSFFLSFAIGGGVGGVELLAWLLVGRSLKEGKGQAAETMMMAAAEAAVKKKGRRRSRFGLMMADKKEAAKSKHLFSGL